MKFTKKEVDKLRKLINEKGVLEMQKYMLVLVQRKSRQQSVQATAATPRKTRR